MEHWFRRQNSQPLGFSGYSLFGSRPQQRKSTYAYSVSGGAGGSGTRISTATYGTRVGSGFGGGYEYQSSGYTSGSLGIGNEKVTMQHLNDRLASYLETVKNLEKANYSLEIKIREIIEKKGPLKDKDHSRFDAIITELRGKIADKIRGNAHLDISIDNACLASNDFKQKMEYEISMRQAVEADVARLRKLLDDTNVIRLHLESDIESLKEEQITLKKNHMEDVAELRAQIDKMGVQVDIDAPKGQDLARIMEEMRANYERIVLKNQKELKTWHETQITEVQVQVTESSTALKDAMSVMSETRKKYQSMDIELQSLLSMKAALEAALHEREMLNNMEQEKYNVRILSLEEALTQIRNNIHQKTREYEKLEAEITEYRRLLDVDLKLEDAVDTQTVQTKVVTVTQTLVDGKVVSESKHVKSSQNKIEI